MSAHIRYAACAAAVLALAATAALADLPIEHAGVAELKPDNGHRLYIVDKFPPAHGIDSRIHVVDGDTFAYLAYREGAGGGTTRELGICAYGPQSDLLADRVTDRIRAWAAEQPALTTTIEIYPLAAPIPSPGETLLTVTKEHTQIVVRTPR